MLVLSRHQKEQIIIEGGIRITVVDVGNDRCRLGIEAPGRVVLRPEVNLAEAERLLKPDREATERFK